MRFLLFLLCLSGCYSDRCEIGARPTKAVDAAVAGWAAAGLPDAGDCVRRLKALPADPTQWGCSDKAAACLPYCLEDKYNPWGQGERLIVVHPDYWELGVSTGEPLIHEVLHALAECALGDVDAAHADPRVWTAVGGVTSAQSLAQSVFGAK